MLIRHPKSEESRKQGLAEHVKETVIASAIGDRQFRAVATKVQKSASQVAFLFLGRNLDMSARQADKAYVLHVYVIHRYIFFGG